MTRERSVAAPTCRCVARSVVAVVVIVSGAPPARAASARVEWEAPEACPGAAAVFERLSVSLGHEPQTLGKLTRVRGDVVPSAAGYRLSLEVQESGRRSSRWLEAASCDDLVDAAVLAITLALTSETAAPQAEGALGASTSTNGAAKPIDAGGVTPAGSSPPVADALTDSGSVPVRGVASLGIVAERGALPKPALGFRVSAGAEWVGWSLGAHGISFGSQRLAARPDESVDFELGVAGLHGCRRWLEQSLQLDSCVELEAGRWEAFGADLQASRRSRDLWLAPGAALVAGVALTSGLAVQMHADTLLPLARKRYIVNENEDVHTPGAVSWRLAVGFVLGTR